MTLVTMQKGVVPALVAALLFGAGTPFAKIILVNVSPWLLAGLLYLGSGIGLSIYRLLNSSSSVRLRSSEIWWFAAAILSGGVIGPVLLMAGLLTMPASGASLLLNLEGVFTALLAWFVFKENFDRRIALGMAAIVIGSLILTWPHDVRFESMLPALAVMGACFAWGVDNNLTRKISLNDATWIASVKGLVAGTVNLALAAVVGFAVPSPTSIAAALVVGFFAYGVSLALFVIGLRHLGTARTGAYFSVAPFFGAILAVGLGEPVTGPLIAAGIFMALGIWLHLSEHHEHFHVHSEMEHEHEHTHDEHHLHIHEETELGTPHTHYHRHSKIQHQHPHFPDAHHQHNH